MLYKQWTDIYVCAIHVCAIHVCVTVVIVTILIATVVIVTIATFFRELVRHMLNQEHTSGEVLQAFDRINPDDDIEDNNKKSSCCS